MLFFRGRGELIEHSTPHPLEVLPERIKSSGIGAIEVTRPGPLVSDEMRLAEHREVLRHRGAAHRNFAREVRDGERPVAQQLEDGAPSGVSESREGGLVSIH